MYVLQKFVTFLNSSNPMDFFSLERWGGKQAGQVSQEFIILQAASPAFSVDWKNIGFALL